MESVPVSKKTTTNVLLSSPLSNISHDLRDSRVETIAAEKEETATTAAATTIQDDHEKIEELKRDQENISAQLSHLSEFLETQLIKIDHKVDNIVDTVTQTSSILNMMLEGVDDYPKLYVVIPIPKNNTLVGNTSALSYWYHAVEEMFNNPKLLYCDSCSVRLYPLCAYSMEPVGEGIEILHPMQQIRELSFVLQLSASILSSLALYSTPLALVVPTLNNSILSSFRYVSALQSSLMIVDSPGTTTTFTDPVLPSQSTSCIPLDNTQLEIFKQIESGYKNGEDIQNVMKRITPEQFSQIKPIANESYKVIRNILDHADPGLHRLRCLMAPCANFYRNEIQWVKIEHINAWKYAKLPIDDHQHLTPSHSPPPPPFPMNSIATVSHDQLMHSENIHPQGLGGGGGEREREECHHQNHSNHLTNTSYESVETISYDPWVLVHPPHVSSLDCEDVERISRWIQTEVHLLPSTSESIATKLVMDNCPHIERLKLRLTREPNYLISLGVSEEDSNDIKLILFGNHSTVSRAWCVVS